MSNGVDKSFAALRSSAPAASSHNTASRLFLSAAKYSGVEPNQSCRPRSARASSSNDMHFQLPAHAAVCSAVQPKSRVTSGASGFCSSLSTSSAIRGTRHKELLVALVGLLEIHDKELHR